MHVSMVSCYIQLHWMCINDAEDANRWRSNAYYKCAYYRPHSNALATISIVFILFCSTNSEMLKWNKYAITHTIWRLQTIKLFKMLCDWVCAHAECMRINVFLFQWERFCERQFNSSTCSICLDPPEKKSSSVWLASRRLILDNVWPHHC